jgi:3-deoxy-D-manno-octulosonic-acid transferase
LLAEVPDLLLVLVPRHPERFNDVFHLCRESGFEVVRRSAGQSPGQGTQVLLGDTMGELPVFFGACDVAFVGGSLVPVGGHNLIEPAAWGVPVVSGPHLFNFAEASQLLMQADAMVVCSDAGQLAEAVLRLLQNEVLRREMGEAARGVAEANRGALAKLLALIAGAAQPVQDPARH